MFTKLTFANSDCRGYGRGIVFEDRSRTYRESETANRSGKELDARAQTALFLSIERGTFGKQLVLAEHSINDTLFTKIVRRICDSENCRISTIDFSNNNITDDAVVELAYFLGNDKKINTVILYKNKISDTGAKLFLSILDTNFTITTLDLSKNLISAPLLGQIETLLNRNYELKQAFASQRFYIEIAETLLDLDIPKDLFTIVLDFLNAVNDEKAREIARKEVIFPAIAIAVENMTKLINERAIRKPECPETIVYIHKFEERMLTVHSQCPQGIPSMIQQDRRELEQHSSSQLLLSGGPSNPRVSYKETGHSNPLHPARFIKPTPCDYFRHCVIL